MFLISPKSTFCLSVSPLSYLGAATLLLHTAKSKENISHPSEKHPIFHQVFRDGRLKDSMAASETSNLHESPSSSLFFSNSLQFCSKMGFLREGKQFHCCMMKLITQPQISLQNQLLNMYIKCGCLSDAHQVFDEMPKRNLVSWNTVISGFSKHSGLIELKLRRSKSSGSLNYALESEFWAMFLFREMLLERVGPNCITMISVLGSCLSLSEVEFGKQLHSITIKSGFDIDLVVSTALTDLYAKCSDMKCARLIFDKVELKDLVLWNVMIYGYAHNSFGKEAFGVFKLMRTEGLSGDSFTFSSLLNACSGLRSQEMGKQIHGCIIKLSIDLDFLVSSTLVDMYAKNENLGDARKAFDGMVVRSVVSWTTLIVGYGHNGEGVAALKLLSRMIRDGFRPDELTLASILSSCANVATSKQTVLVHTHIIKNGFESFLPVSNALINAYSKCGYIESAYLVFKLIRKHDLVTWTSMINAYAFHGIGREAIMLFDKMIEEGVWPDRIAFVGVLAACSHGGLISQGLRYFSSMENVYQITPDSEHYSCFIDLLGRAGLLKEAFNVLMNVPFDPGANVWGAFLGACRIHGNLELARFAAEKLFEMEPSEPSNYALLSNIYASLESWSDVAKVRKMLRERCEKKVPGCSWMEIGSKIHSFVSSDKSHPQVKEIYAILKVLNEQLEEGISYINGNVFNAVAIHRLG
ncbi:hypothetical protein AMTRI_Chr05g74200 [Amborella trichopoda]